jgi:hypothetical protein
LRSAFDVEKLSSDQADETHHDASPTQTHAGQSHEEQSEEEKSEFDIAE